jgi:hypothetical protein
MKHDRVWAVEVSGADAWRPAGYVYPEAYFRKKHAKKLRDELKEKSPGLRFRVRKYKRV